MNRYIPGLAIVRAEIDEIQARLNAGPTAYTASQWGDIQPGRVLLQSRLEYMQELEAAILRAAGAECAEECNFAPLIDPTPHRQHYKPDPARNWKALACIGLALGCIAVAMMLHAAGVLTK